MVLVMTVEPGFGGQSFMADMMPKVSNNYNLQVEEVAWPVLRFARPLNIGLINKRISAECLGGNEWMNKWINRCMERWIIEWMNRIFVLSNARHQRSMN